VILDTIQIRFIRILNVEIATQLLGK
jgi:hypothetical protein